MEVTVDLVESHGLCAEEYERICKILGREPNLTELGIFSVMWSEHCSYKSSRLHLKKLPTEGPQVVQGPGENAGVIDLGGGLAAVFKIESHNHPSFIEPFQGAATGVGGIIRDIFTMGARPVALMNSLHFGPLENTRNQLIMEGVVAGIAAYGNCIGIPTVGGEVYFESRYSHNPIVNVFCLGVAAADRIFYGRAAGVGNPVIYVGAKTGRDGIHGATMASEEFGEASESKRPTVQVGDPFLEKLLLEACLEAMKSGAVIGIQDMGAAGLTCSSCEMAGRSDLGIEIDLGRVPQREPGMTPYEIMLSESQERMLLVAEKGREREVLEIFEKWDLDAVVVGQVKDDGVLRVVDGEETVARIPNRPLTEEAPLLDRRTQRPGYLDALADWRDLDIPEPEDDNRVLLEMAGSPALCSRRWIYRQYDHQVRTDTVVVPGSDAAVLRVKADGSGLAITLDGNPRYCHLDPRQGARLAVAESCRNLVCSGARPLAATNCLNFASPENPEIMWQFVEVVEGIAEACRFFKTPITGGNVSFYNETEGRGIFPTPVLGMVGRMDRVDQAIDSHFRQPGDAVYLLGDTGDDLGGSVYLQTLGHPLAGPAPRLDLEAEGRLQSRLLEAIGRGLVRSAHDLSEGGLGWGLVESCLRHGVGFEGEIESPLRHDFLLFSESPSRVLVSLPAAAEEEFRRLMRDVPITRLGRVTQGSSTLKVNGKIRTSLETSHIFEVWDRCFEEIFRH